MESRGTAGRMTGWERHSVRPDRGGESGKSQGFKRSEWEVILFILTEACASQEKQRQRDGLETLWL